MCVNGKEDGTKSGEWGGEGMDEVMLGTCMWEVISQHFLLIVKLWATFPISQTCVVSWQRR